MAPELVRDRDTASGGNPPNYTAHDRDLRERGDANKLYSVARGWSFAFLTAHPVLLGGDAILLDIARSAFPHVVGIVEHGGGLSGVLGPGQGTIEDDVASGVDSSNKEIGGGVDGVLVDVGCHRFDALGLWEERDGEFESVGLDNDDAVSVLLPKRGLLDETDGGAFSGAHAAAE